MPVQQNTIPRTSVIPGAQDDTFSVDGGSSGGVLTVTVGLTRAQMHDISNPIELVADPGAGLGIAVLGVYSAKAAGAYTAGGALQVEYDATGTADIASVPVTPFRSAATDSRWATPEAITGTPSAFAVPGGGVQVQASADFAGAGGDVTLAVKYVVVDT